MSVSEVETATEKLRALRHLCDVGGQPFYVQILDEALAAFDPPSGDGILEVRPCVNGAGHVVSYDLCPPHPEGATAGPVTASVYAGEAAANDLARAWNTRAALPSYGWQPIETAPRDGTTILAYFPLLTGYIARQDVAPVHWTEWGGGVWENSSSGGKPSSSPTHWRPLPEPPIDQALASIERD
jgi:hypothetical protein